MKTRTVVTIAGLLFCMLPRVSPAQQGRELQAWLSRTSTLTMGARLVRSSGISELVALDDVVQLSEIRHTYPWFHAGAIADGAGLAAALVFFVTRSQ